MVSGQECLSDVVISVHDQQPDVMNGAMRPLFDLSKHGNILWFHTMSMGLLSGASLPSPWRHELEPWSRARWLDDEGRPLPMTRPIANDGHFFELGSAPCFAHGLPEPLFDRGNAS